VLGRSSLMRRDDVREPGDVAYRAIEHGERPRAGVRLVPLHHSRPLVHGHGTGTGVGEQVDEDILRLEEKHVVMRRLERRRAVCVRCLANRLDGLDAERLDDRLELHEAVTD